MTAPASRWSALSLLIVDDEPGMRSFLAKALARRFAQIETAASVEEAAKSFSDAAKTGGELDKPFTELVFAALTLAGERMDAERALQKACDDFAAGFRKYEESEDKLIDTQEEQKHE